MCRDGYPHGAAVAAAVLFFLRGQISTDDLAKNLFGRFGFYN